MKEGPIPARIIAPWLTDNAKFVHTDLAQRRQSLERMADQRKKFLDAGRIRKAEDAIPVSLSAVDAAVADIPLGDMVSILIQVVTVDDNSITTLGAPIRATGVNGHDMVLARTPMRVAAECARLSAATSLTIADTSFWSLLTEVNQAITHQANSRSRHLKQAVNEIVWQRRFLETILNHNVIAMSKSNESCKIGGHLVSDREAFGRILEAGEFFVPQPLKESTEGKFGIEKRMFNNDDRKMIRYHYENDIEVVYYKPHSWTRAFRIEAHTKLLRDDARLMPVLSTIRKHTTTRTIIEPWPQFLADFTSKQIAAVTVLYGELNFHRTPWLDPSRTMRF